MTTSSDGDPEELPDESAADPSAEATVTVTKVADSGFSEAEIAAVTEGPRTDPELDEVDAAEIDERTPDLETPFEKLVQKGK